MAGGAGNQVAAAVSAVLVPGMLTVPAPVLAQDALEEIVVTATRRTRSVQEIPINITALNTGELEKNRLYGLAEISKLVPGLQIIDRGPRDEAPDIIVRGLNSDGLGPGFSSGTVATYLGDIPVELDLKTNDLQTVEVLIGPQGTLYGSGTLGGAIRYIPNKPDASEFTAEVHTSVYGLSEADSISSDTGFVVNVPLIQDQLAVRASVDYLNDSGFIDYNFVVREGGVSNPEPNFSDSADVARNLRRVEDADSEETISGRIGLRWLPTDSIDATLWWAHDHARRGLQQRAVRVGVALRGAERLRQPALQPRGHRRPRFRGADLGHRLRAVRGTRPARPDRPAARFRIRLRILPNVLFVHARNRRGRDARAGGSARVDWRGPAQLDRRWLLQHL